MKTGDRVLILDGTEANGQSGTISLIYTNRYIGIKLDNKVRLSYSGKMAYVTYWYVAGEQWLELIEARVTP